MASHHEDRLAALEPHLDRRAVELVGDLRRRLRQGVHQGETYGGIERQREALSGGTDVFGAGLGGLRQVSAECLDELSDVHDALR